MIINQYSNVLDPEIKEKLNSKIEFKNGSVIEIVMPQKKEEVIRGKRGLIGHWTCDWEALGSDDKTLEEVLEPFVIREKIAKTDGEQLYCSSSDES